MNTLEKYYTFNICQEGVRLYNIFYHNNNLIHDVIINLPYNYTTT
jgi:hypothetical protein